ncbi:hypothetical protein [Ulvibacterium sp.]|uniref:hypothetical protein n=1 Tax=Ulvibacterium sp. TaxID=2665914 RepID=UPI003BAB3C4F
MQYCEFCKTKREPGVSECQNCGLPFEGSEEEKSNHISGIFRANEKLQEASNAMQRAKWILFAIGLITLIFQFHSFYQQKVEIGDFVIMAGLSILITICGFTTTDYPIPSVTLGTIFVIGIYAYSIYLEPRNMLNGIIWKVLILSVLVYAIKTANDFEKMLKNNPKINY